MLLDGCYEGKHTPRLAEVKYPACGQRVEVFIPMGGRPGQTGTLVADEVCQCGHILPAGSLESDSMPMEDTIYVMEFMDALRGQWGMVYPQERTE